VLGHRHTQRWDNLRVDCALTPGAVMTKELAAARQLHQAAAALGTERYNLLNWSIVDDMSWSRLAQRLHMSDKTVCARVVEAIRALTMWRAGPPVPPPPRTRPYIRRGTPMMVSHRDRRRHVVGWRMRKCSAGQHPTVP
jgi:hypothetical protein